MSVYLPSCKISPEIRKEILGELRDLGIFADILTIYPYVDGGRLNLIGKEKDTEVNMYGKVYLLGHFNGDRGNITVCDDPFFMQLGMKTKEPPLLNLNVLDYLKKHSVKITERAYHYSDITEELPETKTEHIEYSNKNLIIRGDSNKNLIEPPYAISITGPRECLLLTENSEYPMNLHYWSAISEPPVFGIKGDNEYLVVFTRASINSELEDRYTISELFGDIKKLKYHLSRLTNAVDG